MNSGAWDCFEHLTKNFDPQLNRKDPKTWKSFYGLCPLHGMMMKHYCAHSQHIWDLRQNPKIVGLFATLWGVPETDLLVSFDGTSFHLPHEKTNRGYEKEDTHWFHVDQSYTRNDFECIQSWVTGYDTNEGDATLRCFVKSHLQHKAVGRKFNLQGTADWEKSTDEMVAFYRSQGCHDVKIVAPKGSMVFWDSRTLHYGWRPPKSHVRKEPPIRNVVYICMTPRRLAKKTTLQKRIKYFKDGRMTSHWPHKVK